MGRNGHNLKHELKTRVDDELLARVQQAAQREDRSEAWVLRHALRIYFTEKAVVHETS